MRILMVSSFLPYPLYSGGAVRLFNLIKLISKRHEITLVCEIRDNQTNDDIKKVGKYCKEIYTVKRRKQWTVKNILKSGFSMDPFLIVGHKNKEMQNILKSLLKNKTFDLIHIETFYVYPNLPRTYLPTVLVEHNIEYLVYEKYKNISPIYMRPLLSIDIEKIKKIEKYFWNKCSSLVAVSEFDRKIMKKIAYIVTNGVSLQDFPYKKLIKQSKNKVILFMGDFLWIQNREAVKLILTEIWPKIEKEIENKDLRVKLWIVGKNMPLEIKLLNKSKNVVFDEKAPDETSEIYKKADILLAPIKVGGGTSFKILESMASGVPVVTTELGIKGLDGENQIHALVGESSLDFAEGINNLLKNDDLYNKIRKNARDFIEKNYTWESIALKLENVYKQTLI